MIMTIVRMTDLLLSTLSLCTGISFYRPSNHPAGQKKEAKSTLNVIHDTWSFNNHNTNLGHVGKAILSSANLCDNSLLSEAISGYRIEQIFTTNDTQVSLWKTETDVKYWDTTCKKIDFIVCFTTSTLKSRVAIETKRISTFNNKVILTQEIVNSILDNASAKARAGSKYVCTPDRWAISILHLLITEADTIEMINVWIRENNIDAPFISIVITLITGQVNFVF